MTGQIIEDKNLIISIKGVYRSYRESQKKRGRKKKEMLRSKNRIAFYSQFIKKGDLCFDIGANIGNRTDIKMVRYAEKNRDIL